MAGTLGPTQSQPEQAATLGLAWLGTPRWSCPSPCMPVGLLWYVKVGGLTVCLLNLANKRHPAKPLATLLPLLPLSYWGGAHGRQWGRGEAGSRYLGSG